MVSQCYASPHSPPRLTTYARHHVRVMSTVSLTMMVSTAPDADGNESLLAVILIYGHTVCGGGTGWSLVSYAVSASGLAYCGRAVPVEVRACVTPRHMCGRPLTLALVCTTARGTHLRIARHRVSPPGTVTFHRTPVCFLAIRCCVLIRGGAYVTDRPPDLSGTSKPT